MSPVNQSKRAALLAAGLLIVLVVLGALFWRTQRRQATETALSNAAHALAEEADFDRTRFNDSLAEMRTHAHFFAALTAVGDASTGGGQESVRQRLQQVFTAALQHGDDIAQLSYLDLSGSGRELVRVERNPADRAPRLAQPVELAEAIGSRELQGVLALPPGATHLSLRLGRQAGQSTRPQLRFLKRVQNPAGTVTGLLVMDRELEPLLSQLIQPITNPGSQHHATLFTDQRGLYLARQRPPAGPPSGDPAQGGDWARDFKRTDELAARLGLPLPRGMQALSARDGSLWIARMDEVPLSGAADGDAVQIWQMFPWAMVEHTLTSALVDRLKLGAAMGGLLLAVFGLGATLLALTRSRSSADRAPDSQPPIKPERRRALQAGLLASLLGILAGGGALHMIGRMDAGIARARSETAASGTIERLAEALFKSEHLAEALRQLPLQEIPTQEEFARRTAPLLSAAGPGVTLQWSPGGVVRYTIPVAGNEAAIGHDLRADARSRDLLQASIQSGRARWDGPFELRQGGVGMVLRLPVYREGAPPGEAAFTGVATSLVNFSPLLRQLTMERPDQEIRAWIANGDGPLTQIFGSTDSPAGEVRVSRDLPSVYGPGLRVEVAVWPKEAAAGWQMVTRALGLGLAAGLLGALAFVLESWRSGLRALSRETFKNELLLQTATDGIHLVDTRGNLLQFSESFARLLGYNAAELRRLKIQDWDPSARPDAFRELVDRLARAPEGVRYESRYRRKDGSEREVEIACRLVRIEGRMVFCGAARDVSERKAFEAALQVRQEQYRQLWETSRDAKAQLFPPEWRLANGNAAAVQLYRTRDQAELAAYSPVQLSPERQPDGQLSSTKAAEMIRQTLQEGSAFFEWRHRTPDGTEMDCEVLLTRLTAAGVTGLQATMRDISARKAAEAARLQHTRTLECVDKLNTSFRRVNNPEGTLEAALDEIAGMIPCGAAFLLAPSDPSAAQWGVTSHSPSDRSHRRAAHGLRGPMTPETAAVFRQIHAASDPIAFGPAEPAAVPAALAELLQSQAGLGISLRTPGAPPWILWLSQAGPGAGWDTEARWLLTAIARRMEDLLAVWLSTQEILRLNSELEKRVDARSMELEVTNEILKRSNEDLAQFASIASHDLKSPLRAIDTLASWISEDLGENQSPAIRENLRLMRQRVRRMERLLDDLLAYSRADKVKDAVRPVQVREMVAEITALIEVPPGFRVELLGEPAGFTTAAIPLRTVLQNLVNNAVKHHDRKTGLIEISVQERGDFYEFQVDDDGPGIPPEHHERIWGMFQTLQPRDKVEGSGIGLALIKRLVQHYGGVVGVQNRTPCGARFSFTWPKTISSPNQAG